MEANFFRFAVEELYSRIKGLRIKKVYMPAPGVWNFCFGSSEHLVFFHTRKGGFLFISRHKLANPLQPSAQAMWLRKRIKNKTITGLVNLWPQRRAAFHLSASRDLLLLDICRGVYLQSGLAAPDSELSWPGIEEIAGREEIWKEFPHITPPLRHALTSLGREQAGILLQDLKQAKAQGFYLYENVKGNIQMGCFLPADGRVLQRFDTALAASQAWGLPEVQRIITGPDDQQKSEDIHKKRLQKNLAKIKKDRERLEKMVKGAETGHLIKSNLHLLDPRSRMEEIILSGHDDGACPIRLDPRKTVLENMNFFFEKAAKGRRGLEFIQKREKELLRQISAAPCSLLTDVTPGSKASEKSGTTRSTGLRSVARRFRSSDGFLILKARSRQAGHRLLSTEARPHDLWFHVQGGPGAHVILKKAHDQVHVPQRSLEEAANIAALSSCRKNDLKAVVTCSRVRDVRKIKGQDQGKIRVDRAIKTILVAIDQDLESRLEY